MTLKDSRTGYGTLSIILHWAGAVLVTALFILGERMEDLPRGPELIAARQLHVGVGMVAFALLALRIGWRVAHPVPAASATPTRLDRVAQVVHVGLLAALTILILSGPLSIWSNARPIDVFGLFALPSPLPKIEWLHEATEVAHGIAAKAILILVGLHVLGALKHLVIDRDGTIKRILVPAREG